MQRHLFSNVQSFFLHKCTPQLHLNHKSKSENISIWRDHILRCSKRDPTGDRERDEIKRRKLEGKLKAKQKRKERELFK
eukprot:UN15613